MYNRNIKVKKQALLETEQNKALQLERSSGLKAEKVQIEQARLQAELRYKEKDLLQAAQFVSTQNELLEVITTHLQSIQSATDKTERDRHLSTLQDEIKTRSQIDDKVQLTLQNLNTVNAAFYAQLQAQFPELTAHDLELSALIRLGLDNQAIALLRGIAKESLHKARYRLRKRMHLTSEQDLDRFLHQF